MDFTEQISPTLYFNSHTTFFFNIWQNISMRKRAVNGYVTKTSSMSKTSRISYVVCLSQSVDQLLPIFVHISYYSYLGFGSCNLYFVLAIVMCRPECNEHLLTVFCLCFSMLYFFTSMLTSTYPWKAQPPPYQVSVV